MDVAKSLECGLVLNTCALRSAICLADAASPAPPLDAGGAARAAGACFTVALERGATEINI